MKKVMLSLLILAGAFTAVLSFHACSADEEADEPQHSPQAQLLLQKSREFAKKYNVNMTLNEDNIEETAKTLSVEDEVEFTDDHGAPVKQSVELNSVFDNTGDGISFSASGAVRFEGLRYSKSVSIHAYYNEATSVHSVSLG